MALAAEAAGSAHGDARDEDAVAGLDGLHPAADRLDGPDRLVAEDPCTRLPRTRRQGVGGGAASKYLPCFGQHLASRCPPRHASDGAEGPACADSRDAMVGGP